VQSELDSFLIEITALILAKKDEDGQPLANKILDKTGMKGTGARSRLPHIRSIQQPPMCRPSFISFMKELTCFSAVGA
jgi:6-phosphogluconate dehydrogenase